LDDGHVKEDARWFSGSLHKINATGIAHAFTPATVNLDDLKIGIVRCSSSGGRPIVGGLNLTDCRGSFAPLLGLQTCESDYEHEANRTHHRERYRNSNLAAA
jgi:hypothetical protein